MNSYNSEWLMNVISLKENKSYILCSTEKVKNNLSILFNCTSEGDILVITPAKLRKEIIKFALDFN